MKPYKFVNGEFSNEIEIKRSEFIATIKGVENEDDAIAFVAKIKKKYSDATHNCYAYIADDLGLSMRFSDDGEPSGTAGQPILETLKKSELKKTAAVVTRYFGGIKLGASGLVSAYTEAVAKCIEACDVRQMKIAVKTRLKATFSEWATLENVVKKYGVVGDTDYLDGVTAYVYVKPENIDSFLSDVNSKTAGKAIVETINEEYYGF